jgi:hypothetical protein
MGPHLQNLGSIPLVCRQPKLLEARNVLRSYGVIIMKSVHVLSRMLNKQIF